MLQEIIQYLAELDHFFESEINIFQEKLATLADTDSLEKQAYQAHLERLIKLRDLPHTFAEKFIRLVDISNKIRHLKSHRSIDYQAFLMEFVDIFLD